MAAPPNSRGVASQETWSASTDTGVIMSYATWGYWYYQSEDAKLYITPDLGWPDKDLMFDPAYNPKVLIYDIADLQIVTNPPPTRKGRDTLIFSYRNVYRRVPPADIHKLGGATEHLWRVDSGGITKFRLQPDPQGVPQAGKLVAESPQILD